MIQNNIEDRMGKKNAENGYKILYEPEAIASPWDTSNGNSERLNNVKNNRKTTIDNNQDNIAAH